MLPDGHVCPDERCGSSALVTTGRSRQGSLKSRIAFQPGTAMRDFMAVTKALADENRVRVLLALRQGELCVCQIVELLGLATSTISKHMSILRQAYLVDSRKDGRWVYYRLAVDDSPLAVRQATRVTTALLADDPQILSDERQLEEIRCRDPHDLCTSRDEFRRACRGLRLNGWGPLPIND